MQVKLSTSSRIIADLFIQENPDTTEVCTGTHINLINSGFSINLIETARILKIDETQSAEDIWSIIVPLFEVHSRVTTRIDNMQITILPTKVPTQVRLRPDTSAILNDACLISGLKKVDVLHQAIRDFHLRLDISQ